MLEANWFDNCYFMNEAQMSTWMGNSSYWGVGVYIQGYNGCPNPTPTWVSYVTANLPNTFIMPIWYGAQPSNAGCGGPGSSNEIGQGGIDPTQQGINDAGGGTTPGYPNTKNSISSAGFASTSTVVLDIENYTNSNCDGAVAAYINGWVWQTQNNGLNPVVYGSRAITAIAALAGNPNQHQPNAIWVACWQPNPNSPTYGGNGSDCPGDWVWNLPQLADSYFFYDQRHHQWLAGNSNFGQQKGHCESYGGLTWNIDSSAGDGNASYGYAWWTTSETEGPETSEDSFNVTGWQNYVSGSC